MFMDCGDVGPWEPTPKWNWRYWLGYDMRRWVSHSPWLDYGRWEYSTAQKAAREALEAQYNETPRRRSYWQVYREGR